MKQIKNTPKEKQKDFFEAQVDRTPYFGFWGVLTASIIIILIGSIILWNLAGVIKREVRIKLPNVYNITWPKFELPKIPDKIPTPDLNGIINNKTKEVQENVQNNIENQVNDQVQQEVDKIKNL